MCDCFFFLRSIKRQAKFENDHQNPLLIVNDNDNGYGTAAVAGDEFHNPTTEMTLILKSWLNGHWLRYLILLACSPLLIPIVCAISPFICAAEVCFFLCRRRRRLKSSPPQPPPQPPHRREYFEGGGEVKPKVSLLDRYLDDQLELALEILHECGGDLGYRYDNINDFDSNRSNDLC